MKHEPYILLITGARECPPDFRIELPWEWEYWGEGPDYVLHGGARGVDAVAAKQFSQHPYARTYKGVHFGARVLEFSADWEKVGKAAGPIRNQAMVDWVVDRLAKEGGKALCLAYPSATSRGTWDCIRKAVKAGIPTHIYPLEGM